MFCCLAGAFISFSELLEYRQLYFHQKIGNCVIRLSNSGFKKGVKLLKFCISSAINLLNFNVLIDDQQYVFFTKKKHL